MSAPLYLVTGAGGFVGRYMVDHLLARGIRVRAMVRSPAQAEALRARVEEVVIADLQRPETLPAAVKGVAGIYHIAALFRQAGGPDTVFFDINARGVDLLMQAAIDAGVGRFILCSTNGVHSHIDHPPADETAPFNPSDTYQASKLEGEKIAMRHFAQGRIRGAVLRPAMIYGPGDERIGKMFRMIGKGRFFYIGKGQALTHWLDVRDLAQAFHLAMDHDEINAEAFLIAGRKYMTLKQSAEVIAAQLGVRPPWLHLPVVPMMWLAYLTEIICAPFGIEPPLFRRRVSFFLKHRAFDISKARRLLGYEPAQDFAGEVADIIADYRARGLLPEAGT